MARRDSHVVPAETAIAAEEPAPILRGIGAGFRVPAFAGTTKQMFAALLAAWALATLPALAQTAYPARAVRLVVAYAAGGTGDIVGRLIADRLASRLGQPFTVDNRAGASGAVGTQFVVNSVPDGYTLLVGQTGEVAINQHWLKGIDYDPDRDLQPVALAAVVPLALVVPRTLPYGTLAELLAGSASHGLTFASAGTGTPGHFAGELLKLDSHANLTHVPYKGAGPALNDLLGGHVDMFFSGMPAAMPLVKAGTIRLMAVSTARRSSAAPDAPTVAEAAGIKDFDISLWAGFFAPRATPKDVVAKLNREINAVLLEPAVKARLLENGAEVTPMSSEEFTGFVHAESEKYARIVKAAGVTPE
jgi:tripartite-type tricarboxylate transporter receptor subunit TctC